MEQQQPKQNQQLTAYKKLQQENKKLKAQIVEFEKELQALKKFIGIGDKK